MIPVRQSTAFETAIGPVLDADGVAVTDCTVADFKIKKTTGNFAALNGSATLTHVSAGVYDLVLTTSDLGTVGLNVVAIDDTVNACAPLYLQVMEEAVYDSLYAASAVGYQVPIWAAANSTVNLSGTTIKTATDVETDTADIQTRIPAALTADGNIKADALRISGSATAADNAEIVFATDFAFTYDTTNKAFIVSLGYMQGDAAPIGGLTDMGNEFTNNGYLSANLYAILQTPVTQGASGRLAGAFSTLLDVATPVFTAASVNQTGDTYALANGANGFAATKTAVDAKASQVSVDDLPTNAELATALGTADDAVLSAIAALNNLSNAQLTAAIAAGDDATLAAIAALPTAAQNAAGLLDLANGVETGLTLREAHRLQSAAAAGKLSGAATTTIIVRNAVADSKDRITATVDSNGNRSAVTLDLS